MKCTARGGQEAKAGVQQSRAGQHKFYNIEKINGQWVAGKKISERSKDYKPGLDCRGSWHFSCKALSY